jgi:hypothetical protein
VATQTGPQPVTVPERTGKPSLIGLSAGSFMVLDLRIVSVALPAIGASLHTGLSGLQ